MKVNGTRSAPATGAAPGARASSAQGFSISADAAGKAGSAVAARVGGVNAVGSVDALLAMQEAEGPLERRRRAVGRGGRILDVLEKIKLALLDGHGSKAELERLARAIREERTLSGDSDLDGVLDEIETRAAVEMAKAEMSRIAA